MLEGSFFEAAMLICFGLAWPVSIYKSYTSKRNEGKSVYFLFIILIGYVNGISFHIITEPKIHWVLLFYFLNTSMIVIDIVLYYQNERRTKEVSKDVRSRP